MKIIGLEPKMVRTVVGTGINGYVSIISLSRFGLSESVLCLLTFRLGDGASSFGFVGFVALVRTCVGTGIIYYITII